MAPRRLPRGTRVDPVALGYVVERPAKERFDGIASSMGISSAALFDLMIETMPVNDRGWPAWLPESPRPDGELPIDQL